ncbi:MAG: trk system potassium uptake protein TrkA [Saprospiraceae bacterium]|jgi:trk system potassium uptake protein TrkA
MNILIGGAGDVGFHLAKLMVTENQNITLIDHDDAVLEYSATHLDVSTIKGEITSIETLMNGKVGNADLFIAVSTHESANLLACILAKKLGAKKTIARVANPEYFHKVQRKNFKESGVDNLFSPSLLAVQEIKRLIGRASVTDVFEFEEGKISIIGFTADQDSNLIGKSLRQLSEEATDHHIRIIVLLRGSKTIIPSLDMIIEPKDHLYLSTDIKDFDRVNHFVGKTMKKVKKVMIIGSGALARRTAKLLEKEYSVSLIMKNKAECKRCHEELNNTLILQGDPNNTEFLLEYGLESMDAFVALTPNSETNIISCLMAERTGEIKTIALVDNSAYTHISQNIGVDTIINKKILAANNIFRFVRRGRVEAIASFHGVDAEVIEFVLDEGDYVIGKQISEIGLPKEAIVAGVIRDEKGLIPRGTFELSKEDKVIIFVLPIAVKAVESIFN